MHSQVTLRPGSDGAMLENVLLLEGVSLLECVLFVSARQRFLSECPGCAVCLSLDRGSSDGVSQQ
jgi:hypothetical protein